MKRQCSVLWLVIFMLKNMQLTNASIAGVTYMDNFDFQERYRDVNECNPFYWHPLHLPEECMQIFDTLIRSRLKYLPYRIYKQREEHIELVYPYTFINTPIYVPEVPQTPPPTPFEILFNLLKRDIQENPSLPTVQTSPYFGSVVMYKQPVSFKSVTMIKKLAQTYANAYPLHNTNRETYVQEKEDKKEKKKGNTKNMNYVKDSKTNNKILE